MTLKIIEPTPGFLLVLFTCLRLPPEVINIHPRFPGLDNKDVKPRGDIIMTRG